MQQKWIFFGGIVLIVALIVGLALMQERIVREGTAVVLETRPVDPRDLFRGEYVILRYEIERDPRVIEFARNMSEGDRIHLRLREGSDGVARVVEVRAARPPYDQSETWITGEVGRFGEVRFPSIEQYYVPEGTGRAIEELRDELHVRVGLRNGEARLIELLDGDLNVIDPFAYRDESRSMAPCNV